MWHRFYIYNESLKEAAEFQSHTGIEIYEVVRVTKGVPLFIEDHLKRFFHSGRLCHVEIPLNGETIIRLLNLLISSNGITEGNIRFSWGFQPEGSFQAYFIPHHYPTREEIREGVICGILEAERKDPNAKVVQSGLRLTADQMIRQQGCYEILLLNSMGEFTEGSRSNLFFVKKNIFITSPAEEVLPGITRNKVIDLIRSGGRKLEERSLPLDELESVEAAFITGTSPKILPVRMIGDLRLKTDVPEVRKLMTEYDGLIWRYLRERGGK